MSSILRPTPLTRLTALSALSAAAMLTACGGGSSSTTAAAPAPAPASAGTTLSGTVAVGAPITNGKLRILDATGAVVASDIAIDDNGHYADVALTGSGPWRIEACGYAGPNYTCVYSVAGAPGTANVTPLTTATMLLATGQAPDALMNGDASALTADNVAAAQAQLRSGLSGVLASAGVGAALDFVSGSLAAGSRTGYDGVLDAVGVSVGQDDHPFVQITPRLGDGNLYLQQGSTSGSVTVAASADSLQLSGLEVLFANMSEALAGPTACASATSGIQRSLAANARMTMGDGSVVGAAQVAEGLCQFFAQGDDGSTPMWGSRLLSPTLGRCDFSGAAPLCAVSFTLKSPEGDVQPVGNGMAVTKEGGAWKFYGDVLPISIYASAKAQRTVRIDGDAPVVEYDRAFAFEVAAVSGLACAKISQRSADGAAVTIGYYKRLPGQTDQRRLSLWTTDGWGNRASTDPLVGALRSADDTWIALPQGAEGDAVIRNFYRGGRSVKVALYADTNCGTPFMVDGKSEFDVEVQGVPPVWSAMSALPWPAIDAATGSALRSLALAAGADASFDASWTFPHGPLGVNGSTVCGSRADCGEGGTGRLGDRSLRPGATSATIALHNNGSDVAAGDGKTLALYGRTGDGVDLQSNFSSCPMSAAGDACH